MALLGAHVSASGGVANAFANAAALGCDALQLFVKNANRWSAKPLTETQVAAYREARAAHYNPPVTAHASYLINLAAVKPETLENSRTALKDELTRCHELTIPGLVLHPGAHMGAGLDEGLGAVARSLDVVFGALEAALPESTVQVWLENTAGQGTTLGRELSELSRIISLTDHPARLGVCLDTCHAFAAGYEIHTEAGLQSFLDDAETQFGLGRVGCFHLNDSRFPLGSRRDRHANLGEGEIGLAAFSRLAADPRFTETPMLLETPHGEDGAELREDLGRLRRTLA